MMTVIMIVIRAVRNKNDDTSNEMILFIVLVRTSARSITMVKTIAITSS